MRNTLLSLCLGLLSWAPLSIITAAPSSINSAQIITRTLQAGDNCFHYRVVGVCEWLICHHLVCHPATTLKLDHYLPDLVVSVFNNNADNPWWFAEQVVDPVMYQTGSALLRQVVTTAPSGGNTHSNSSLDMSRII